VTGSLKGTPLASVVGAQLEFGNRQMIVVGVCNFIFCVALPKIDETIRGEIDCAPMSDGMACVIVTIFNGYLGAIVALFGF
jgi:hypothetical protein